jgi:hypothetical protein
MYEKTTYHNQVSLQLAIFYNCTKVINLITEITNICKDTQKCLQIPELFKMPSSLRLGLIKSVYEICT